MSRRARWAAARVVADFRRRVAGHAEVHDVAGTDVGTLLVELSEERRWRWVVTPYTAATPSLVKRGVFCLSDATSLTAGQLSRVDCAVLSAAVAVASSGHVMPGGTVRPATLAAARDVVWLVPTARIVTDPDLAPAGPDAPHDTPNTSRTTRPIVILVHPEPGRPQRSTND